MALFAFSFHFQKNIIIIIHTMQDNKPSRGLLDHHAWQPHVTATPRTRSTKYHYTPLPFGDSRSMWGSADNHHQHLHQPHHSLESGQPHIPPSHEHDREHALDHNDDANLLGIQHASGTHYIDQRLATLDERTIVEVTANTIDSIFAVLAPWWGHPQNTQNNDLVARHARHSAVLTITGICVGHMCTYTAVVIFAMTRALERRPYLALGLMYVITAWGMTLCENKPVSRLQWESAYDFDRRCECHFMLCDNFATVLLKDSSIAFLSTMLTTALRHHQMLEDGVNMAKVVHLAHQWRYFVVPKTYDLAVMDVFSKLNLNDYVSQVLDYPISHFF